MSPELFVRGAPLLVLVLALHVLALGSAASAAQPSGGAAPPESPALLELDYQRQPAAAGCVSARQLARDVEDRLGRRVFVDAAKAEIVARVRARRVARRFVIELALFDRAGRQLGQRQLSTSAAHCSSLDDSLALVLALAADMPREPEPAPATTAGATEPSTTAPQRPDAPSPAAAAARPSSLGTPLSIPPTTHAPRLGLALRPTLGVAAALGYAPALTPGIELGVELRMNHFWPIRVHAAAFAEQRQAASVASKAATFSPKTLSIGVCPWSAAESGFEGTLCVVQCLGRIAARGVGFDEEQRNDGWVFSAGTELSVARELGPVFLSVSGALLVPVVRRRYFFTDGVDVTLYEQPWLGGLLALRVGTEI